MSSTDKGWGYSTPNGGFVRLNYGSGYLSELKYTSTNYEYKPNKTYILRTDVKDFYDTNGRLNVSMPFGHSTSFTASSLKIYSSYSPSSGYTNDTTTRSGRNIPASSDINSTIIFLSENTSLYNSVKRASYNETYNSFSQSYIKGFDLIELDWYIQGYSIATSSNTTFDLGYEGWRYLSSDKSFEFQKAADSNTNKRLPYGSTWKQISSSVWENNAYTKTNYVSKYVSYENFNLQIEYENLLAPNVNSFVNVYLTKNKLPNCKYNASNLSELNAFSQSLAGGQYVGKISTTGTYSFYNLSGGSYLNFVANYEGTSAYKIRLSNIQIEGGYSEPDNNIQLPFSTTSQFYSPTPLSVIGVSPDAGYTLYTVGDQTQHLTDGISGPVFNGATGSISNNFNGFFSPIYGTVTNLSLINSKMGNGTFKSGIWENGVWNNGWRVDEEDNDFDSVVYAFQLSTENKRWRIQITGSTYSASQFEIGDKVSIGNIIAIDINEKRKLLKNYFTIVNKSTTDVIVEVDNNFPIRRIEKDSENHKIKITKNVWLNGAFLNGIFHGVWNNGLFKGYPIITEMYNTHWIDGKFDGGHFNSEQIQYNFLDTYYLDGFVGLSLSSVEHSILPGDLIEIDKDDKSLNPQYDGNWVVTTLTSPGIVKTNIPWGINTSNEGGLVKRRTKTGLIQNFKFKDNNVAQYDLKSIRGNSQSYNYSDSTLEKIWKFNSWIDVNYTTYSTTNIGRNKTKFGEDPQSFNDFNQGTKIGQGEYSEINLYGYTTEDVLSSESLFRDIDSKINRYYSLGTKYEIFEDYLGDFSNFDSPFDSASGSNIGLKNFYNDGWTFSYSGSFAYNNGSFVFDDNAYVEERVGFIGLTGSDLRVGDEIYISQYSGATYLSYNGTSSITKIIKANAGASSPYSFIPNYRDYYIHVTNKIFEGSTGAEAGTIRYTKRAPIGYTISRTVDSTIKIEQPNEYSQVITLKNSAITIPKRRYSILEFDLIDYDNITATTSIAKYDPINLFNIAKIPNPNDIGYTIYDAVPKVPEIDSRYLGRKNKTYYFNRLNLNLGIYGLGGFTFGSPGIVINLGGNFVELDNIKFYEVDMIPFFQYTTEDYVNKSVQVPYKGVAPFIDYVDENFSFIENIVIGFDGILTNSSNNVSSSVIFNTIDNNNIYYGHEYSPVSYRDDI
jgi:hypothetical protein